MSETKENNKYDLMYGMLGNGITVFDKNREESGDYKKVAHISENGVTKFYEEDIPQEVKDEINKEAEEQEKKGKRREAINSIIRDVDPEELTDNQRTIWRDCFELIDNGEVETGFSCLKDLYETLKEKRPSAIKSVKKSKAKKDKVKYDKKKYESKEFLVSISGNKKNI